MNPQARAIQIMLADEAKKNAATDAALFAPHGECAFCTLPLEAGEADSEGACTVCSIEN